MVDSAAVEDGLNLLRQVIEEKKREKKEDKTKKEA